MNSANSTLVDMINNTIVKFSFSFHRNNFKSFDKTKHTSAAWVEKKEKCGEFLCLKFIFMCLKFIFKQSQQTDTQQLTSFTCCAKAERKTAKGLSIK
jgi:hypothetical protein